VIGLLQPSPAVCLKKVGLPSWKVREEQKNSTGISKGSSTGMLDESLREILLCRVN